VDLGAKPPKPMSGCENNACTIRLSERFTVTTNVQNTLQHFQRGGGKCPLLPMPADAHVPVFIPVLIFK